MSEDEGADDALNNTITGGRFYGTVIQGRDFSGQITITTEGGTVPADGRSSQPVRQGEAGPSSPVVVRAEVIHGDVHVHQHEGFPAIPCQLPSTSRYFVNRTRELSSLTASLGLLADGQQSVINVIDGSAGVGKTALAVRWAKQVRDQFPDGQLYVDLRGFDPSGHPLAAAGALLVLLESLGVPTDRIPAGAEARSTVFRSLTAGRRMLIVLDNAADTRQVEPLIPGDTGCMTVVTSRTRLDGLITRYGADRVPVDVLAAADAHALLVQRLGQDRLAAEPEAAASLVQYCQRLPLALSVVAARAAVQPGSALEVLAGTVRDARTRLDALTLGDVESTDLRAVFSWSYDHLSPDDARAFRLLGIHPGHDVTRTAVASVAALSDRDARRTLESLTRTNLLEQYVPERFRFHDLLRSYAAERAEESDSGIERDEAMGRGLDSYLHTLYNASRRLTEQRPGIPLDSPRPGAVVREFDTFAEAMIWHKNEFQNLLSIIEWTAQRSWHDYTWRYVLALWQYLYLCGQWQQAIDLHVAALSAAERTGDAAAAAAVQFHLGICRVLLGNPDRGSAHFDEALALYTGLGDLYGQGNALDSLAWAHTRARRFREAIDSCEQALRVYRLTGDLDGQARALDSLCVAHTGLQQFEAAIDCGRQALELADRIGDRLGQAHTLRSLGLCHGQQGQHQEAIAHFQQALAVCRELEDRHDEASTLRDLGNVLLQAGDRVGAGHRWQEALVILRDLNHPEAASLEEDLESLADPG